MSMWSKVTEGPGDCWTYPGHKTSPYGKYGNEYAHRISYETQVAPIPDGWDVDHVCQNPSCVNPWHLRAVPRNQNRGRGRRGWCESGHAMIPEQNLRIRPNGSRQCHQCTQVRNKRRYGALKEKGQQPK